MDKSTGKKGKKSKKGNKWLKLWDVGINKVIANSLDINSTKALYTACRDIPSSIPLIIIVLGSEYAKAASPFRTLVSETEAREITAAELDRAGFWGVTHIL
ncbi:hypothetical protein BT69DRAFT_1318252 [Atractiella rhizophila]|nr:hypothetical protein BT69DRAFT_1318252 [Atractiella rhizophila]